MLKCLLLRRKLYDYSDNSLSDIDKIRVKEHLDVCNKCQDTLEQIKNLLDLAAQKNIPQPSEEFWHNFKIELDRKLNQKLVPQFTLRRRCSYSLKPALAYTLALIFILVIGSQINKNYRSIGLIAQTDEELVDEMELLDELEQTPELNQDKEASYKEEIELLLQYDQNLT